MHLLVYWLSCEGQADISTFLIVYHYIHTGTNIETDGFVYFLLLKSHDNVVMAYESHGSTVTL